VTLLEAAEAALRAVKAGSADSGLQAA
jgi:hypothetical protein